MNIEREKRGRKKARFLRRFSTVLGAIVIFITTYALILPAITMETPTYCGSEEHVHNSECYSPILICGHEDEPTVALHSSPETVTELICSLEEHTHDETCLDEEGNLICSLEEHQHSDSCYQTVEVEPEEPAHVHTAECYEYVLTCQKTEHQHSLQCFSDPEADTDFSAWEKAADQSIQNLSPEEYADTLDRVLAVAASQENYTESQQNYWAAEDGVTKYGYTFYGAVYGAPYAEWNALYVDWVLQKAAVPGFPLAVSADDWLNILIESDQNNGTAYLKYADPQVGDLAFVQSEAIGCKVGIISTVTDQGFYAYEGDYSDKVALAYYDLTDARIEAYVSLPVDEVLSAEEPAVEELVDEVPEVEEAVEEVPAAEEPVEPAVEETANDREQIQTEPSDAPELGEEPQLSDPAEQETVLSQPEEQDADLAEPVEEQDAEEKPTDVSEPVVEPETDLSEPEEESAEVSETVDDQQAEAPESETRVFFSDDPEEEVVFSAAEDTAAQEPVSEPVVTADPDTIAAMQKIEETTKKENPLQPVVDFFGSLFKTGYDSKLTATTGEVTVIAEYNKGVLPENATMAVTPVNADPYTDLVAGATGKEDTVLLSYDITFLAGNEIVEPDGEVKITFQADFIEETVEPEIVHIEDDGNAEVIEGTVVDGEISGVTDSFSVYVISYTVDFQYHVNGNEYGFTLKGEDAVSLRELIGALHVFEAQDKGSAQDVENPEGMPETESGEESQTSEEEAADTDGLLDRFMTDVASVEFTDPELLAVIPVTEDSTLGRIKADNGISQDYAVWRNQGEVESQNSKAFAAGDWALISLQPFDTEEELTITMKNGEVFSVVVTDAQDALMQDDGIHVDTITNPAGTTIDLFDYWVDDSLKDSFARKAWPGYYDGWYYHDENDYEWYKNGNLLGTGNESGINAGHMFKFSPAWAGTVYDGTIANKVTSGLYSPTRNPTNVSYANDGDRLYYTGGVNSYTGSGDPNQGLVEGTLVNGYPKLTKDPDKGTDGESLAYLFSRSSANYKDYYGDVNNLLYVDREGYYTYDSRDYKATLDGSNFELTAQTSDDPEVRGFWPFGQQRFWVGMHMNTQFSMPSNGQVLNPNGDYKDMQFEFSGDDDTWLYIDGVLVGDGGGVHNRTEIDINFAAGTATVTGEQDENHMGTFTETKWLDDIFKAAGKYNDADWEDIGDGSGHKRFKAGTYHTFDMFYLERGGGESNLYIHYNLVSTADFTGHKAYEGFGEGARMTRDQFQFEMIGLDGQYQSVYDDATQTATVTMLNENGHAIMPTQGTESGAGTVASPKKEYSANAWGNLSGYIYTTGVTEDGNINFGTAEISDTEMHNCDEGHPSLYRYIIREIVPPTAVNADGVAWSAATDEQKAAGGFVLNDVTYDGTIYYMTARVTSWDQTGPDGTTYKRYGLSKTYYTDDTFTTVADDISFVSFLNTKYGMKFGEVDFTKVNAAGEPLSGAEFTLYRDEACTTVVTNGDSRRMVVTSGQNGVVTFEKMPVGTYYMKETKAPAGYALDTTVYQVIIADDADEAGSRIIVNGDETETAVTRIINKKPGEITVVKKWQTQNGSEISGGSHAATVQLKRKHVVSTTDEQNHTISFKMDLVDNGNWEGWGNNYTRTVIDQSETVSGETVTIEWYDSGQQGHYTFTVSGASYTEPDWGSRNGYRKIMLFNISDSGASVYFRYTDVYWLYQDAGHRAQLNVIFNGSGAIVNSQLQDDETFNNLDTYKVSLNSSNAWNHSWTVGGTESSHEGCALPAVDDQNNKYVYYIVELNASGNEVAVNGNPSDGVTLVGYSANNTAGITDEGVLTVTNQLTTPPSIDITIKKTDDTPNSTNYLDGALFKLMYRSDSSVTFTNVSSESVSELDSDSQFTVPTAGITLTGLVDGQYQLLEISPPAGYVITNSTPVTFAVSGGAITSTEGTITGVRYTAASETSAAEFIIPNTPGAALPNTGGPGTRLFTIFGSILILGAGVLLWRRLRLI